MHLHLHLHPTTPLLHRQPLAEIDRRALAVRATATLLAAYGVVCIVWGLGDSEAPALLVSLGLYALLGGLAATLAPRVTAAVLALTAPLALLAALAACWLDGTWAGALSQPQIAGLVAVPFAAGILLAAGVGNRPDEPGRPSR